MVTTFEMADAPAKTMVRKIRSGLPAGAFARIARHFPTSKDALARKLGMTTRNIHRKSLAGARLSPAESEKLMRLARIWNRAGDLFASNEAVAQWLMTPAPALGGMPPLDLLDTDVGANEVEGYITGLAHGNFQ
jgi:putative toxin-antitoxin system antitoxin component (TIGR02293 family)